MPGAKKTPKNHTLTSEKELAKEVKELAKEIQKLKDMEFIRILKHPGRLMWLSFLKGAFVGLGSVLGATILVAILAFILNQFSYVPFVGNYFKEIQTQIEPTN